MAGRRVVTTPAARSAYLVRRGAMGIHCAWSRRACRPLKRLTSRERRREFRQRGLGVVADHD
jgi:hypothetical protein